MRESGLSAPTVMLALALGPPSPRPSCARELSHSTHTIVVLINVCMCAYCTGGKSAVGTVTLTLDIPEADSERSKLFDNGEFKLCYHGDYKTTSVQKPVAFKSCSKKFNARRKSDRKKRKKNPLSCSQVPSPAKIGWGLKRTTERSCRHNKI